MKPKKGKNYNLAHIIESSIPSTSLVPKKIQFLIYVCDQSSVLSFFSATKLMIDTDDNEISRSQMS